VRLLGQLAQQMVGSKALVEGLGLAIEEEGERRGLGALFSLL
jgi:hypothetical protein